MRRLLLFVLGAVLFLATPYYLTLAQTGVVESPKVSGTLGVQFDKDYLVLRVDFQDQPLQVLMDYVPQGRWELDDRSGFFIFDPVGFEAYLNGANPGPIAIAAGDRLPGEGRRLQAIIEEPSRDYYHVVIYNDSNIPMNYILTTGNGRFVDEIGGQVIDVYNPPPSSGGEPPLVVVPGPTPTPTFTPLPPRRTRSVHGVLTARYDSNFHEMVVLDTGRPVQIEMTYDPPEQYMQDKGFEFNVFSEHQLRVMLRDETLPWRADDMTEGHLTITPDGRYIWRAEIVEPYDRYTIVVSQWRYALLWLRYRLTLENAAFLVPRELEPAPAPTSPLPTPGPFVVVEVQKKPTPVPTGPTPTPTLESASPLPTPTITPVEQPGSPLPTPTITPISAAPQEGAVADAIESPTPQPVAQPAADPVQAASLPIAAAPLSRQQPEYRIFLPFTARD